MLLLFIKSLLVGMAVSVPVGPVGLFCFERTASCGTETGLVSVGMMNIADVVSAAVLLLAMALVQDLMNEYSWLIRICTGLLFAVIGMGIVLTRKKPPKPVSPERLAATGLSTFLLSISPTTVGLMILLFPMFNITMDSGLPVILSGVFFGSVFWSFVIIATAKKFSEKLKNHLATFKLCAGLVFTVIGCFGAFSQFL